MQEIDASLMLHSANLGNLGASSFKLLCALRVYDKRRCSRVKGMGGTFSVTNNCHKFKCVDVACDFLKYWKKSY